MASEHKLGDRFTNIFSTEQYLLAMTGLGRAALVNMRTGRILTRSYPCENLPHVSEKELGNMITRGGLNLLDRDDFEKH